MKTAPAVWQAINAYDIEAADAVLPFSRRLARDNGWSAEFARRAIAEYKRFIYLACVSGRTVTPSEEIDSVWHLHLIYTRDYWDRFCGETLKRPIHHGPTAGGEAEANRYRACYRETLDLYRTEFGTEPACDIWPDETIRFGAQTTRVIDSRTHLIMPKRQVFVSAACAAVLLLAACAPEKLLKDPVPILLACIIAFVVVVVIVSAMFSAKRRGHGGDASSGSSCGAVFLDAGGSDSSDSGSGDSSSDGGSGCGSSCGGGCGGGGD